GHRLIGAAHNTETNVQVAALHESGNNRVEGPLAGSKRIRMLRVETEKTTAVLQEKAHTLNCEARTEPGVVALDQGDDVAVLVHGGKIGGIAGGSARLDVAVRLVGIDQACPLSAILPGNQALHRNFAEARVSVVAIEVGVGKLHRFNLLVQFDGTLWTPGIRLEIGHDVQHFQSSHSLAVGRRLVNAPAAVVNGDGVHPLGGELSQVIGLHSAACVGGGLKDRFRDLPAVEGVRTLIGNQAQSAGHVGIAEHLTDFGNLAVGQENA